MSHASLLTWIPWEIKQSVSGLHAEAYSPQAAASVSDPSLSLGFLCAWHGVFVWNVSGQCSKFLH